MFDEHAFVDQVEGASAQDLTKLLTHPAPEQERALRTYLGDERYRRMHELALRSSLTRGASAASKGNVVVIPGVMGSHLDVVTHAGATERVWVNPLSIIGGGLGRLGLAADGLSSANTAYDVQAAGIIKLYYGELLLALAKNWNVRTFWYDWRKDLNVSAAELAAHICGWFRNDEPVHFVAHSMGGIIARTYIHQQLERWNVGAPGRQGRLVMLGTPNHGAFSVLEILAGIASFIRKLALLDLQHTRDELVAIVNSFVSLYQMLPSQLEMCDLAPLYCASAYGHRLAVMQERLDAGRQHHAILRDIADPTRMSYIAGYGEPTIVGVKLDALLELLGAASEVERDVFVYSPDGDGTVSHNLGLLIDRQGVAIPTWYIRDSHCGMLQNPQVLSALDDLLASGATDDLSTHIPQSRGTGEAAQLELRHQVEHAHQEDERQLQRLAGRLRVRGVRPDEPQGLCEAERAITELLARDFLSGPAAPVQPASRKHALKASVQIRLVHGDIGELPEASGADPIDALAVDHYVGFELGHSTRALDQTLSAAGDRGARTDGASRGLLASFAERNQLGGELGQLFFIPDPRAPQRTIVVAGRGLPGRFGVPELTVLARELTWACDRMGKHHLATVLIGAGRKTMPVADAVAAWLRGVRYSLLDTSDRRINLRTITFVERDPRRVLAIDDAIVFEQRQLRTGPRQLEIHYTRLTKAERDRLAAAPPLLEERTGGSARPSPVRLTITQQGDTIRFGALTETASFPERAVSIDQDLVRSANNELAAEWDAREQLDRGQFLARLLLPADLRDGINSEAPLVLILDTKAAQIHWELLARTDLGAAELKRHYSAECTDSAQTQSEIDPALYFYGTSRGLTRQLRTTFAPIPEPQPPQQRVLRVLIVADPAEDERLPDAEAEGLLLADLFEQFNHVYPHSKNSVEVVRLIGPRDASRTAVLRQLMQQRYDVLHFAGHCEYRPDNPAASGWVFGKDQRLTANELCRIDRIPKFVFSNACESGVTSERPEGRSAALAPSFAEAFFAQGVSNFVCTAWPVQDDIAQQFALHLYAGLLGIEVSPADGKIRYRAAVPRDMYQAMQIARRAAAQSPNDIRVWGAYQHYGNPFYRFFETASMDGQRRPATKQHISARPALPEPAADLAELATTPNPG